MRNGKLNTIVPCLWFDDQAEEAAEFYTSLFDASEIDIIARYGKEGHEIHGQPEGKVMTVDFTLAGQAFTALNGGPHFKFTPAISFIVNCSSKEEVDSLWEKLSDGGNTLMPLDTYPFSDRYGWTEDKYGLSWQLILANPEGDWRPKITPSMMFVGEQAGKAEEAIRFYTKVFKGSKTGNIARYGAGQEPDKEGTIMYGDFTLKEQWFAVMDSARAQDFNFNEAISFAVKCETQEEIDYYWHELSAIPEAEQCGWLKDGYGVSWQVVPSIMNEMFEGEATEKSERVMKVMLQMKKLDLKTIKEAYEQQPA